LYTRAKRKKTLMHTLFTFVRFPFATVVVCLVILTAGCSSIDVYYDVDKDADFTSYKTYDWMPPPEPSPDDRDAAEPDDSTNTELIRSLVDAQLVAKGLEREPDNPDLLVMHHGGSENRIDVGGFGYAYGGSYSGWQGAGIGIYSYHGGTLIVDLVDARTGQLAWRGSAQGTLVSGTTRQAKKVIVEAIEKLFEAYPPEK